MGEIESSAVIIGLYLRYHQSSEPMISPSGQSGSTLQPHEALIKVKNPSAPAEAEAAPCKAKLRHTAQRKAQPTRLKSSKIRFPSQKYPVKTATNAQAALCTATENDLQDKFQLEGSSSRIIRVGTRRRGEMLS